LLLKPADPAVANTENARRTFPSDGYDGDNRARWTSNTVGRHGAQAFFTFDGDDRPIWASTTSWSGARGGVDDMGGSMLDRVGGDFGSLLRGARVAAGLSQEALAERAGLSSDAVAALERGRRRSPRPSTLAALASALHLSPEERAILARTALRRTQAPMAPAQDPNNALVGRDDELATVRFLLGGLPLALELAAARIRVLTLPSLLDRMDRRLDVPTGGPRGGPDRRRSLWATLDWSYGLLGWAAQRLFRFAQDTCRDLVGGRQAEALAALERDHDTGLAIRGSSRWR
jgi:transcriptional regulator with XRE-family HTH domain